MPLGEIISKFLEWRSILFRKLLAQYWCFTLTHVAGFSCPLIFLLCCHFPSSLEKLSICCAFVLSFRCFTTYPSITLIIFTSKHFISGRCFTFSCPPTSPFTFTNVKINPLLQFFFSQVDAVYLLLHSHLHFHFHNCLDLFPFTKVFSQVDAVYLLLHSHLPPSAPPLLPRHFTQGHRQGTRWSHAYIWRWY